MFFSKSAVLGAGEFEAIYFVIYFKNNNEIIFLLVFIIKNLLLNNRIFIYKRFLSFICFRAVTVS